MTEKELNASRLLIGEALKKRREELGFKQSDVAFATGLGLNTIGRMEDAKFWPGLKQYLIVLNALELSFEIKPIQK